MYAFHERIVQIDKFRARVHVKELETNLDQWAFRETHLTRLGTHLDRFVSSESTSKYILTHMD